MISWSFLKKRAFITDLHQICPRISNAIQCVICNKKSEPRDKASQCMLLRASSGHQCVIATKGLRHHNPSSLKQPISVVIAILQNGNIHSCVKIWRIWYLLCLPYHRYWWSSSSCPSSWRPETQTWLISKSARQCHAWQHFLTCLLADTPTLTRTLSTAWISDKKWKH